MERPVITGSAIDRLTLLLGLKPRDRYSQDWELEVSDPAALNQYLCCYEEEELNVEERCALLALILPALDGAMRIHLAEVDLIKKRIVAAVRQHYALHLPLLSYWALPEEDIGDVESVFAITEFVRDLIANCRPKQ